MEEPFPAWPMLRIPCSQRWPRFASKYMPKREVFREELRASVSWLSAGSVCMKPCVRVTVPQNPECGCISVIAEFGDQVTGRKLLILGYVWNLRLA